MQNQPGQGHPRSASTLKLIRKSREIRKDPSGKRQRESGEIQRDPSEKQQRRQMFCMDHVYGSHRDLKMSPFKHVRKQAKNDVIGQSCGEMP